MVLNWNALRNALVNEKPYRWILFQDLIEDESKALLRKKYPPEEKFFDTGRNRLAFPVISKSDQLAQMCESSNFWRKQYQESKYTDKIQSLSDIWQQFIQELWQPEYLEVMEELSGLDLQNNIMTIGLYRGKSGFSLGPHVDQASLSLVHLIYLNEEWLDDWGGNFQVLTDNKPTSVVNSFQPTINNSISVVNAQNSWHLVSAIAPQAPPRLYLDIIFWKQTSA